MEGSGAGDADAFIARDKGSRPGQIVSAHGACVARDVQHARAQLVCSAGLVDGAGAGETYDFIERLLLELEDSATQVVSSVPGDLRSQNEELRGMHARGLAENSGAGIPDGLQITRGKRSEEHTPELQSHSF